MYCWHSKLLLVKLDNMMSTPLPADGDKWQQLAAFIKQHSTSLPSQLVPNLNKIFLIRLLIENLFVFLIQYAGLNFSMTAQSPTWFASGTACAFLFMRGPSVLPGIWLGSYVACFFAIGAPQLSIIYATIYSLQAFLLMWIAHRTDNPTLLFNRRRKFIKLIIYYSLVTAITTFLLQLMCHRYLHSYYIDWLGNLNGILLITFPLITLDAYFPEVHLLRQINKLSISICYIFLGFACVTLMCSHSLWLTISLVAIISLLLITISTLYNWCGMIAATFMMGILISMSFFIFDLNISTERLVFFQIFLMVETLSGLIFTKPIH